VLFIINDYLDLALAADADGIHIGQEDFPPLEVRRHLPVNKIVGCSVKTTAQAMQAQQEGADYLAIGSIFSSKTKPDSTVVGINTLKEIRQATSSPLVAIGGINRDNIGQVMVAGADCAAVIDAVLSADDIAKATRELVSIIELVEKKKLPQ
jgi:thiamine-phosphate pyrophosphorylase